MYLSIKEVFPAQVRYSYKNSLDKLVDKIAKGDVQWNKKNKKWDCLYNNQTSTLSEKQALPVVKAPFGYVLVDGHHDVMASLYFDAITIPIKVIEDMSHYSSEELFWNGAEKRNFAYLLDLSQNRRLPPKHFENLIDDPNRYFASLTKQKIVVNEGKKESFGALYPLWIKKADTPPFIEFKIADALCKGGHIYDYSMGKNPPIEFIEKARQILLDANILGLNLVQERKHYTQLDNLLS